jgi:hypothetical protein
MPTPIPYILTNVRKITCPNPKCGLTYRIEIADPGTYQTVCPDCDNWIKIVITNEKHPIIGRL